MINSKVHIALNKQTNNMFMKLYFITFLFLVGSKCPGFTQSTLARGEQPQITVSKEGLVRLVFGENENIFYSTSMDRGITFSSPILVGEVKEMHLGMTRGPQLASSKDYSIVTAIDKKGNIHSFQLNHKSNSWSKIQNVNDIEASAPEGLMSITADDNNNFYAVWLDLREERKNNICFSTLNGKKGWSRNRFAYRSPESYVCECCKPSIIAKNNIVSIMFRNWLKGSRDLYLITSTTKGQNFSEAQKLGKGTWPLKGCPMDGGGLSIDSKNNIHTAWQREGQVFYAQPGLPEEKLGEGRNVFMNGNLVNWENGSDLIVQKLKGKQKQIGEGTALKVCEFSDKTILAVWEQNDQIKFKKITL
jgi:hypothetical protein